MVIRGVANGERGVSVWGYLGLRLGGDSLVESVDEGEDFCDGLVELFGDECIDFELGEHGND